MNHASNISSNRTWHYSLFERHLSSHLVFYPSRILGNAVDFQLPKSNHFRYNLIINVSLNREPAILTTEFTISHYFAISTTATFTPKQSFSALLSASTTNSLFSCHYSTRTSVLLHFRALYYLLPSMRKQKIDIRFHFI